MIDAHIEISCLTIQEARDRSSSCLDVKHTVTRNRRGAREANNSTDNNTIYSHNDSHCWHFLWLIVAIVGKLSKTFTVRPPFPRIGRESTFFFVLFAESLVQSSSLPATTRSFRIADCLALEQSTLSLTRPQASNHWRLWRWWHRCHWRRVWRLTQPAGGATCFDEIDQSCWRPGSSTYRTTKQKRPARTYDVGNFCIGVES